MPASMIEQIHACNSEPILPYGQFLKEALGTVKQVIDRDEHDMFQGASDLLTIKSSTLLAETV